MSASRAMRLGVGAWQTARPEQGDCAVGVGVDPVRSVLVESAVTWGSAGT